MGWLRPPSESMAKAIVELTATEILQLKGDFKSLLITSLISNFPKSNLNSAEQIIS